MLNLLRLLTALSFLIVAGLAAAQSVNSGSVALQRFIGSDGLGLNTVKRSDLDELWREPIAKSRPQPPFLRANAAPGSYSNTNRGAWSSQQRQIPMAQATPKSPVRTSAPPSMDVHRKACAWACRKKPRSR